MECLLGTVEQEPRCPAAEYGESRDHARLAQTGGSSRNTTVTMSPGAVAPRGVNITRTCGAESTASRARLAASSTTQAATAIGAPSAPFDHLGTKV